MKMIRLAAVAALLASASSWAFMPAPGLWNFTDENVGQPGRGMMIEVQNETLFLTYFGYRADGSSAKYNAVGPIVNNAFTGSLGDYQGGPVIGGTIQPAVPGATIGNVSLSFTSGTHGTITLPGDAPRPIFKKSFGYPDGPDGLLGTWIFSETIISTFSIKKTLSVKLAATSNGNGIVSTASGDFLCEFQVTGSLAGMITCFTYPMTTYSDNFLLKFAGDRATGIDILGLATSSPSSYPAHALRVATRTGAQTGLNDATASAVQIKAAIRPVSEASAVDLRSARALESASHAGIPYDLDEIDAVTNWVIKARAIIPH